MITCQEIALDDAIAITAIPVGDYELGLNEWQLMPYIADGDFSPRLDNAITIGLKPHARGGALIPIVRKTGKAEDSEDDNTPGRLHTVRVTCEIDGRANSIWQDLLTLERTPSHLLLTFRDSSRAFVAATKDTYTFMVNRDGGKIDAGFTIQNLMGIQIIV